MGASGAPGRAGLGRAGGTVLAEGGEGGPGRQGGPVAEEEVEDEERGPVPAAMDQCVTVERELEKVLQKFSGYGQLCERSLEELIQYAGGLRREILQTESTWRPPRYPLPLPRGAAPSSGVKRPKTLDLCGLGDPSGETSPSSPAYGGSGRVPLLGELSWGSAPVTPGLELCLCF